MTAFHPGIGTLWSERDLDRARQLRSGSLSFHEIGRALGRSADAVCSALVGDKAKLGRTIHADVPYGYLIGSPRVVVDRHAKGATVSVKPAPWGMTRTRLEFLSPDDPAIDLFVSELLNRLSLLAERELERLEKRQQAKDEARRSRPR